MLWLILYEIEPKLVEISVEFLAMENASFRIYLRYLGLLNSLCSVESLLIVFYAFRLMFGFILAELSLNILLIKKMELIAY